MDDQTITQVRRAVGPRTESLASHPGLLRMFGDDQAVREQFEQEATRLLVPGGHLLFEEGDPAEHLYIVIHGRLQVLRSEGSGPARLIGEVGMGELCGERSLLAGECRSATVRAVRDTEMFELSREGFDRLVGNHPRAMRYVAKTLTERLSTGGQIPIRRGFVSTIAVVPLHRSAPVEKFADRLARALESAGEVVSLDAAEVDSRLGEGAADLRFDAPGGPAVIGQLHRIEAATRFVLYRADERLTEWSRKCIRQADRVLLLAEAGAEPARGEVDAYLKRREAEGRAAERELVVLDSMSDPANLEPWTRERELRERHHIDPTSDEEFDRLARTLSGHAVGLVLSGGGARTLAHIGVVRAIREAGIPIDFVGGTSGGAIIAAQVALGWDDERMERVNREHFVERGGLLDLGLPMISLIKGRRFKRMFQDMFGEVRIEDLRIPFFCVSTNLSQGELAVHREGILWRWVRASISVPGLGPPLVDNGELYVDGSVLNNLPIDVMRRRTTGAIIAVSVGSRHGPRLEETRSKTPSRWSALRSRLLRGDQDPAIPSIVDIIIGSTMISGLRASQAFEADADLVIRPEVQGWGQLEFSAMEALAAEGYRAASEALAGWSPEGDQPSSP